MGCGLVGCMQDEESYPPKELILRNLRIIVVTERGAPRKGSKVSVAPVNYRLHGRETLFTYDRQTGVTDSTGCCQFKVPRYLRDNDDVIRVLVAFSGSYEVVEGQEELRVVAKW